MIRLIKKQCAEKGTLLFLLCAYKSMLKSLIAIMKKGFAMKYYFEEIIGYEDVKNLLRQLIDMLNSPEKYIMMGAHRMNVYISWIAI